MHDRDENSCSKVSFDRYFPAILIREYTKSIVIWKILKRIALGLHPQTVVDIVLGFERDRRR